MAPPRGDYSGFWGERTSTIDWCEKNYEVTYFIAEFWNTVTNLVMILLPLWGISEVYNLNFEKKFVLSYITLLSVGIGSWAFHMTLLYPMQLMDELPMVWGACYLFYSAYENRLTERKEVVNRAFKFLLVAVAVSFTILFLIWPLPLFHNSMFAILTLSAHWMQFQLFQATKCKTCKRLFFVSFAICGFAFFLWNIDRHFCPSVTAFRNTLPDAAKPLTQLHGWWHCLVGYGFYLQILHCIHAYYDVNKEKMKTKSLETANGGLSLIWSKSKHW